MARDSGFTMFSMYLMMQGWLLLGSGLVPYRESGSP
jgi:hypothetical protein